MQCTVNVYGYATEYKKSVHANCFLNSRYFGRYGPGYGVLFRLFSAVRRCSPLFSDQNDRSISYIRYFLYSVAGEIAVGVLGAVGRVVAGNSAFRK